jgi:hypothetical protein
MEPNFELLRDAYAIIDGIPESYFALDQWREDRPCGTVACAAGWLMQHPQFQVLGLRDKRLDHSPYHCPVFNVGITQFVGFSAMAHVFNLSLDDADDLFDSEVTRLDADYEHPIAMIGVSDKDRWKARVRKYLKQHGQPVAE